MSKKKPPTTIEECNAEMELTQKKIRQYENRNKMLDRKLAIEKRKERNHRLCSRGGYLESLVPALIDRPGVKFCVSDFRQSQEWRWKAGRILA